ncbi:MAG: fasciclin domain-containing protein [Saprospiraceae bacterium]|nr:fasciclin domain-containing protein [Saprospiraceae bacterium]
MTLPLNSPVHTTLVAAVSAAGLVSTLQGDGPFTVFAPTDAAFAALPAGTIEALLADPQGALADILLYHTVGANALSSGIANGQFIKTINGKSVSVKINADGVFINNAKVTVADVIADNGVVHVIDAVILPPSTVVDIALNSPVHTTLVAAVSAAGLVSTLQGGGPFTVFAPTDAAFAALPAGTIEALLADPQGLLTQILLYHAVAGEALSSDLSNGQTIATINGKEITVTINADGVFINNAKVTVADLLADNGVVHVIDAVLLPPSASNDVNGTSAVTIYPNPSVRGLTIESKSRETIKARLIDLFGREIEKASSEGIINLSFDQIPGTYLLEVQEGVSKISIHRVVKL